MSSSAESRRTFRAGSVLSILLLLLFMAGGCEEQPPGYYEHEDDGFSLILPDGWNFIEDESGASIVAWRGEKGEKAPTVTVVTVDLPEEASNASFADLNFRDAAALNDYFFIRDEPITVDGDSLQSRVYAYPVGKQWRQAILVSLVSEQSDAKRGYVINCSSASEKYQGDREQYLQILNSFRRE